MNNMNGVKLQHESYPHKKRSLKVFKERNSRKFGHTYYKETKF